MLHDLRVAARSLIGRRELLAVAVATLGVAVNGTIFSIVNGVLRKPLLYRDPERLAILWHELGEGAQFLPALHPADYVDYRERSRLFEAFTIATGGGRPGRRPGATRTRGRRPRRGQLLFVPRGETRLGPRLPPEERVAAGPRVAVLGDALWRSRFVATLLYGVDPLDPPTYSCRLCSSPSGSRRLGCGRSGPRAWRL